MWGGKAPTQLGPLERANLNHWTKFPERRVFLFLEYLSLDKVQKPTNSVWNNIFHQTPCLVTKHMTILRPWLGAEHGSNTLQ
jgi:hypothetical protein